MPTHINAYDSGDRLEPHPWVKGDVATPGGLPRQPIPDDYGKVDFTNDSGETVFTAHFQKTEAGYILRVDEHQDVELAIETSSDRQIREAAMMHLDAGLRVIAAQHPAVYFADDGEPEAFAAGNFVFTPMDRNDQRRFAITEEFVGTDTGDDDRIPNSWTWEAERGSEDGSWEIVAAGECTPDTIEQLLDQARSWAAEIQTAHAAKWPQVTVAPEQQMRPAGPSY